MKKIFFALMLACMGSGGLLLAETPQTATLNKLSALSGEWEGTYVWSGARSATGKMAAHYYTTGNGSAVVEDLINDGDPVMTSVYHLDAVDLRVTHFCAADNQPRLKATGFARAHDTLTCLLEQHATDKPPDCTGEAFQISETLLESFDGLLPGRRLASARGIPARH